MYTMKISLSSLVVAALAASTQASPTPVIRDISADQIIQKRASITEACNIGYCTQNGGTTGGAGGTTTTVSTLPQLTAAAKADGKAVIIVQGTLSGNAKVKVSSHKTLIGAPGSSLTGIGFQIWKQSNVIVRNMKISKVLAENGDAITIQASSNVWVDHCDLSSDMDHGKDYYDGLCDISHGADWITISNTHFHDHYKASLVGHSDKNGGEDQGHFHVTYANNYWSNINSRTPLVRFGTVHIYNTYWNGLDTGVNTRMGAQVLVQSSVFENTKQAIFFAYSSQTGYAVVQDVDLGGSTNTAPQGTLTSVPYQYSLLGSSKVKASVTATVGQRLTF